MFWCGEVYLEGSRTVARTWKPAGVRSGVTYSKKMKRDYLLQQIQARGNVQCRLASSSRFVSMVNIAPAE